MKNKKLNLNDLKVESFVTSLEGENSQTVKGGTGPQILPAIAFSLVDAVAYGGFIVATITFPAITVAIVVDVVNDKDKKASENTTSPSK